MDEQKEEKQYVTITLEQYTNWMLKVHTLAQIQKISENLDGETFYDAVSALIEN